MADILKVACVQMTSSPDIQENLEKAAHFIREAAAHGATFIVTPENTCHIRTPSALKQESAKSQDTHVGVPFFAGLARELGVKLLIGSMAMKEEGEKLLNRSLLFAQDGTIQAAYDKIHLFDVALMNGEIHRESDVMAPGNMAVTAAVDESFTVGLSICYDLRFAYLYRSLAQKGANILCVPAAFTIPTGQAHWEILLRARAIETGSYVMASAQVGEHEGGRKTYGHSMIIDPWGSVIAQAGEEEGIILADLDIELVNKVRDAIPALNHDRDYTI
ncbi:MAG: amidohydrolase [Alphaproteobacteria bacterium]|nr:MAG: amidohydrolase [Alphaproteobacteria bacterium]